MSDFSILMDDLTGKVFFDNEKKNVLLSPENP
jgi:hypothetical protein